MDLKLYNAIGSKYKNNAQKTRVVSERWAWQNAYCPRCGNELTKLENNRPVADFLCTSCKEEFELKSKKAKSIGKKITDGAFSAMIKRINAPNGPNFFFLTYDKAQLRVNNFLVIPSYYFTPNVIEKRKPLSKNARRPGWVGCNILTHKIPASGRIYFVKNSIIIDKKRVLEKWNRTSFLKNKRGASKGWILEIMNCIDRIPADQFTLRDVYKFEDILKAKYPNNNFIKDKIRQQLQLLRDKGVIEFLGDGRYKKQS